MRPILPPPDSLDAAFEPWAVGAVVANLWWTRGLGSAAIEAAGRHRLAQRIAHAREHSPFYRRHYRQAPPDAKLADLPPVTKGALMAAFDDWATDRAIAWHDVERFMRSRSHIGQRFLDRYLVWTSSGTTGTPGVFLQDAAAITIYDALVSVQIAGSPAQWGAAYRGGRAALVTADTDHFAAITAWRRQARCRPWLDMESFAVTLPLPRLVAALERYDPAFVSSYPTVLALLAEEQKQGRLHLDLAGLWSGGEALSRSNRALIEEAFGCPVHDEYGASECLSIGYACARGAIHVNADYVVLEPVDRDYAPTPPGELSHTVLLTNLANAVQPIVRYDLGDRVRAHAEPCPCGNPLPAIDLQGRSDDVLAMRTADGAVVKLPPLAISTVVEDGAHVHRFQIVQEAPDGLALRLARADRGRGRPAMRALRAYLAAHDLGNVAVRLDDAEPRRTRDGKIRQVLCRDGH
ncbi:MAG: phenylacetate--CoA ligase family protein [Burkholderiales bacterium]